MQRISSALSGSFCEYSMNILIKSKNNCCNYVANNNCEYPANKQQSMIYKSQSLLNSNNQNLSIFYWPQQAKPFENNQKVSTHNIIGTEKHMRRDYIP